MNHDESLIFSKLINKSSNFQIILVLLIFLFEKALVDRKLFLSMGRSTLGVDTPGRV